LAVLFAVALCAALALLIGYRSRLAAGVSFFLLLSLHQRNPTILHGGDNLLRYLLLWMALLPSGMRWSVTARRSEEPPRGVASVASFGFLLQLCIVYWLTVSYKWNPDWLTDHTAIGLALEYDAFATRWGETMAGLTSLNAMLTPLVLAAELVLPFVVWCPWRTASLRSWVVLAFVLFHLVGLAPAFHLGIFPWVCAIGWCAFLPGELWDHLDRARGPDSTLGGGLRAGSGAPVAGGRLGDGLAGLSLALTLAASAQSAGLASLPPPLDRTTRILGMQQEWNMFARPSRLDGWFLVVGRRVDGSTVDLRRGGAPDPRRPSSIAESNRNTAWRKYLGHLKARGNVFHRRLYVESLCRRWNRAVPPEHRVESAQLWFMLEETVAPGEELPARPWLLWAGECAMPPQP
jgi:hypothetical protein